MLFCILNLLCLWLQIAPIMAVSIASSSFPCSARGNILITPKDPAYFLNCYCLIVERLQYHQREFFFAILCSRRHLKKIHHLSIDALLLYFQTKNPVPIMVA